MLELLLRLEGMIWSRGVVSTFWLVGQEIFYKDHIEPDRNLNNEPVAVHKTYFLSMDELF